MNINTHPTPSYVPTKDSFMTLVFIVNGEELKFAFEDPALSGFHVRILEMDDTVTYEPFNEVPIWDIATGSDVFTSDGTLIGTFDSRHGDD